MEKDPTYVYNYFLKGGSITSRVTAKGLLHFLSYYPADTSIYNLYQWKNIIDNKKLVYYNPNSDKVKEYDYNVIKKWKIKSFITRSTTDSFSSYYEVTKFYETIENKSLITIFDSDYSHLDYGLVESAYEEFYIPLVQFLENEH